MKFNFLYLIISLMTLIGCKNKSNSNDISQRPFVTCAPITNDAEWYKSDNVAPIIEGLDVLDAFSSEICESRNGFSIWF